MEALIKSGITAATVSRAVSAGLVERVSRGTYRSASASFDQFADFALVSARAPGGVICLYSAASFHGFGDVSPFEVWLAIPNQGRPPKIEWPKVRAVRWRSSWALSIGVETHTVSGVAVKMTGRPRTVLDMLRMKATVGEDRALEVLRDFTAGGGSLAEVRTMAERFGVGRSVAPYLNAFSHMERMS